MIADFPLRISIRRPPESDSDAFANKNIFSRMVNKLARQTAELLKDAVHQQLLDKKMVVTGALYRSVTETFANTPTGMLASASSDLISARTVEQGSSPHTHPFGAIRSASGELSSTDSLFFERIYEWTIRKGISTSKSVAYRIARSISVKGTPSNPSEYPLRHPFDNARRQVRRRVDKLWSDELDRALERANNRK